MKTIKLKIDDPKVLKKFKKEYNKQLKKAVNIVVPKPISEYLKKEDVLGLIDEIRTGCTCGRCTVVLKELKARITG